MSFDDVRKEMLEINEQGVLSAIDRHLSAGTDAEEIIQGGLLSGMLEVGRLFKENEMFIPEVLMVASIMNKGLDVLKPHLSEAGIETKGKVAIGTVKGDLHDIGKNLVGMFMEINGYEVVNLGLDVSPAEFVDSVKEHKVDAIAMSALLSTTMEVMRETIQKLDEASMRNRVKVIIGGAPVNQSFADQIGADGYAMDASSAVELCDRLFAV